MTTYNTINEVEENKDANLYVIHGGELFVIVNADSEEEALNAFCEREVKDKNYREHVSTFVVNWSIMHDFYKDKHGSFFEEATGEYPKRIQKMKNREEYTEYWIEKNAKDFWKDSPQYADEYLKERDKYYSHYEKYEEYIEPNFSEGYYLETCKLLFKTTNYYGELTITKINLPEKNSMIVWEDGILQ